MSEQQEPVVFQLHQHLSMEQMEELKEKLGQAYGDRMVIVLPPGITKSHSDQLVRIERKLDALLEALADDDVEEPDPAAITLDGDTVPADRDQSQSLG
jgi:hypothetical protein